MSTFNGRFAVRLSTLNLQQRRDLLEKMTQITRKAPVCGMPMYSKYLLVERDFYGYTQYKYSGTKLINIRTIKRIFKIGE